MDSFGKMSKYASIFGQYFDIVRKILHLYRYFL